MTKLIQSFASQNLIGPSPFRLQENAKKLSDAYKMGRKDIPWTDIAGLRNRIVHDYGNVELSIVYSTLTQDVPDLIELFEEG